MCVPVFREITVQGETVTHTHSYTLTHTQTHISTYSGHLPSTAPCSEHRWQAGGTVTASLLLSSLHSFAHSLSHSMFDLLLSFPPSIILPDVCDRAAPLRKPTTGQARQSNDITSLLLSSSLPISLAPSLTRSLSLWHVMIDCWVLGPF